MSTVRASRIIAVSPDPAFAHLAAALNGGGGAVELHPTLESLGPGDVHAALCVIQLGEVLAPAARERLLRLGSAPLIAVLPRSNLATIVDLMQASERIAGMAVAEELDLGQLAAMARRILDDRVFGLEPVLAPGTQIRSQVVGDFHEMSACMSQVAAFVDELQLPRPYREPIEQCIEEMLMNALYDAPVDEHGQHVFAGVPTRTRITQRTEHRVVVQYAYDGARFAVSVRDAFGTLQRSTVLRYLHKCLHDAEAVDRKAGGAGLGLYLMLTSASAAYFNVLPGIATEAVCVFDIASPKPGLGQFGFFTQADAGGQAASPPARVLPAPSPRARRITRALTVTVTVLAVLVGVVAWRRFFGPEPARVTVSTVPPGATIDVAGRTVGTTANGALALGVLEIGRDYPVVAHLEGYEPKQAVLRPHAGSNALTLELQALARVELDSQPTGATVEIDGTRRGETPLALTSLVPGATVSIVFKRRGYRAATASLQVPAVGSVKRLLEPLQPSDEFVRVHFVSDPPGAEVIESGQAPTVDRTYTPADVLVEAGAVQRFTLTMPNHVPLVIDPFTPARGETGIEKGGKLVAAPSK